MGRTFCHMIILYAIPNTRRVSRQEERFCGYGFSVSDDWK